ncbi:amphi-Trp domain-containing protein [Natronolimnobius baerhuensis]|uniref:Amphi-Trp domain-containing protein n=1 Tax=Natronolimnobius baerhuensis TaxID=253108 RepID=A0A202E7V4_9EURY|nr:amphi-Trp domain-containing protein [Natronolimnobius baerhuensis]OVE84342.1 amphi-Trp domain-containing protein [Natronolimnobius baerhuensis]
MAEEVLFKFEQDMDRSDIANSLRTVADSLEAGEPISLEAGGDSVTVSPPPRPTFEIKAERETSSSGGDAERSIEFELEWDEGDDGSAGGDSGLTIE